MRLFTARHPDKVAGLILIEPAIPEEWIDPKEHHRAQIARGTRLCRYGTFAARSGLARVVSGLVRIGALGPARALVSVVSRGGLRREDEGILAPIWKLPPDARRVLRHMWTQPKFFEALGSQIEHICDSADEVVRAGRDLGELPLIVMSASTAADSRLQADSTLARASTRGRHVLVPDTGHWIPLDAPQAVIDVITTMVTEIRRDSLARDG
jgi:pimeloyl-ACP methyl ester carboxylesterase